MGTPAGAQVGEHASAPFCALGETQRLGDALFAAPLGTLSATLSATRCSCAPPDGGLLAAPADSGEGRNAWN